MNRREINKVAAEADVDRRTVLAFLEGRAVQPKNTERITRALATLGITPQELGA